MKHGLIVTTKQVIIRGSLIILIAMNIMNQHTTRCRKGGKQMIMLKVTIGSDKSSRA